MGRLSKGSPSEKAKPSRFKLENCACALTESMSMAAHAARTETKNLTDLTILQLLVVEKPAPRAMFWLHAGTTKQAAVASRLLWHAVL